MAQWILFLAVFINIGFAAPTIKELTNFILANEETYVQSYEGDKIYLKKEHLIISEEGSFLMARDLSLPLPIQTDRRGAFIRCGFKDWILNKCPGCEQPYFVTCKTKGCRYNPKTKGFY